MFLNISEAFTENNWICCRSTVQGKRERNRYTTPSNLLVTLQANSLEKREVIRSHTMQFLQRRYPKLYNQTEGISNLLNTNSIRLIKM